MNLYVLRLAVRAAELFIDLIEVIAEWWTDIQNPTEGATEGAADDGNST